jgi:hypothetical protein
MLKLLKKNSWKKNTIVARFSSSDNEISLPPSEEELYSVLEATPKNDQPSLFTLQKPNGRF